MQTFLKIKKHFHCLAFYKILPHLNYCKTYGRERQTTDQNKIRGMGLSCWIKKSTN